MFGAQTGFVNAAAGYHVCKDHRITFHPGGPPPAVIASLDLHRQGKLDRGLEHKPMMRAYYDGRMVVARAVGQASGAELLNTSPDGFEHGDARCLSSARMAQSADHGLCNPYGEVFGYPRLFISDSAGIPGGTGGNPALTIAANAERISAYIVLNK